MCLLLSNTESCDEDDDEVGVGVVEEELADKPGTTNGKFSARGMAAPAFSAKSPCCLRLDADVAVSVLREVSFNTVLARYHFPSRL